MRGALAISPLGVTGSWLASAAMPIAPLVTSLALLSTLAAAPAPDGGYPDLPSDTPATFTPAGQLLDHTSP